MRSVIFNKFIQKFIEAECGNRSLDKKEFDI